MLEAQNVPLGSEDFHGPPALFVSAHTPAMVAIGFLALSMVASLLTISIVHDYFFMGFPPVVLGGSLLAAVVGAGCVVSFLVWFSRSYRNLRALGAEGLEYSPGVAVGWWFVPVVIFWKPFRVAVEIWKASDPTTRKNDLASRARVPTPALLAIWWMGWLTALVGLGLNYAAYESQVYRAALEAIPKGQWEASYSLGMNPLLAFRRIILPQAFRIALPPMTNDFVSLFKDTSVAYVISVWELATAYRELANATGKFLALGIAVSAFYMIMSLPLAHLARRLERRLQNRQAIEASTQEVPA